VHRARTVLVALSLLAACGAGARAATPEGAGFVTGPYLLRPGKTKVTIMWTSAAAAAGLVRYGAGGKLDREMIFRSREISYPERGPRWEQGKGMIYPKCRMLKAHVCEARLAGLKPGTEYGYEVSFAGKKAKGSFRTFPDKPEPFTFIAYGDSRAGRGQGIKIHREIAARFAGHKPELILHTGDMVNNDHYPQWKRQFFDPLAGVIGSIPLWPAIGNHEKGGRSYSQVFSIPDGNFWYSFDYAGAHFVSLDSSAWRNRRGAAKTGPMLKWLEKDLAASRATWKILFYHEPSYDMGLHWSGWGRKDFLPVMRKHGADLVLSGDSHSYQRFRPMYWKGENEKHPVTYIITAGGGAPLYWLMNAEPHLACAARKYHYMVFKIDGGRLSARVLTTEGKLIDSFAITKKADGSFEEACLAQAVSEEVLAEVGQCLGEGKIVLSGVPAGEKPAAATFKLGAGRSPMKFEIRLAGRSRKAYAMKPVAGNSPPGGKVEVTVAVRARGEVKRRGSYLRPRLVMECAYQVEGRKGRIESYPVRVRKE